MKFDIRKEEELTPELARHASFSDLLTVLAGAGTIALLMELPFLDLKGDEARELLAVISRSQAAAEAELNRRAEEWSDRESADAFDEPDTQRIIRSGRTPRRKGAQ